MIFQPCCPRPVLDICFAACATACCVISCADSASAADGTSRPKTLDDVTALVVGSNFKDGCSELVQMRIPPHHLNHRALAAICREDQDGRTFAQELKTICYTDIDGLQVADKDKEEYARQRACMIADALTAYLEANEPGGDTRVVDAIKLLRASLEANPRWRRGHYYLMTLLARSGSRNEALRIFAMICSATDGRRFWQNAASQAINCVPATPYVVKPVRPAKPPSPEQQGQWFIEPRLTLAGQLSSLRAGTRLVDPTVELYYDRGGPSGVPGQLCASSDAECTLDGAVGGIAVLVGAAAWAGYRPGGTGFGIGPELFGYLGASGGGWQGIAGVSMVAGLEHGKVEFRGGLGYAFYRTAIHLDADEPIPIQSKPAGALVSLAPLDAEHAGGALSLMLAADYRLWQSVALGIDGRVLLGDGAILGVLGASVVWH